MTKEEISEGKAGSFESLLKQLNEIVNDLEHDGLELEIALRLFENGVTLARALQSEISQAEQKITAILDDGSNKATFSALNGDLSSDET